MKIGKLMVGLVALSAICAANVTAEETNPNRQALKRAGVTPGISSGASGYPARPDGAASSNGALWATAAGVGTAAAVAAGIAALLSAGTSSDSSSASSSVTTTTSTE
jgi:hypothetical protein